MTKSIKRFMYATSAAVVTGFTAAGETMAANNFNNIAKNINNSITELPGLLTALSYMMGLIFAVMGVLKIKDHVEQPTQKPLKDGAIALAAGGALFALPIVLEAMRETVGTGAATEAAALKKSKFNVN